MKLTNNDCKYAEVREKPYKLADGGGLYLLVKSNGAKHWRLKYRFLGKEKLLALGPYPLISLADARERRDDAKRLLVDGKDPMAQKQAAQRTAVRNSQNTFKAVALEWHERQIDRWSENHALNVMRRFDIDIFPYIGSRPIADIDAPELLDVLRRIENRGSLDVAARVKQICGQVFRYGIATGRCKRDHSVDLKGALKTGKTQHYPALDIKEMPEFLRALERNEPRLFSRTRKGIRLLMLTFVRTSELIKATWDEFDLENGQWVIPAERMKVGGAHIVPLSRQAIKILKELKEETEHLNVKWVLPGQVRPRDHMSNNTLLFAIGRLGYKGRMTGHGFRALAMSTIKERLGYRHEVVDRQLAHAHKSKIDRAYDRAKFLDERTIMMQEWADYLDSVESGGKIVFADFKKKRA
ncbi:MAG: integrase arm-type DNA-binding domain-containing protein [Alphaproteobacteria bacterium]|nr:integrase arm-type DNA-binding domain-containing protein [Alphaproteobacteria bacterium]